MTFIKDLTKLNMIRRAAFAYDDFFKSCETDEILKSDSSARVKDMKWSEYKGMVILCETFGITEDLIIDYYEANCI